MDVMKNLTTNHHCEGTSKSTLNHNPTSATTALTKSSSSFKAFKSTEDYDMPKKLVQFMFVAFVSELLWISQECATI
jgi:hypothetical protein